MIYIIVAIATVILLLPLMYELPNYVYGREYAILKPLRWHTPIYIFLFLALTGVLFINGLVMIGLSSTLTFFSVRMWLGIIMGVISVIYFIRIIPIYYDEKFDVRSGGKALGVFIRELCALLFFTGALFLVSVYVWSFIVDAAFGVLMILLRLRRYLKVRRRK